MPMNSTPLIPTKRKKSGSSKQEADFGDLPKRLDRGRIVHADVVQERIGVDVVERERDHHQH
jgi:hypothetical protein